MLNYKKFFSICLILMIVMVFSISQITFSQERLPLKIGPSLLHDLREGKIEPRSVIKVIIRMNRDPFMELPIELIDELRRRVESLGGYIGNHAFNNVQVWISIEKIEELAAWEEIRSIDKPTQPSTNAITSEGVGIIGAIDWHNKGIKGRGVKVGIIDVGFKGYEALMGIELPTNVKIKIQGIYNDFIVNNHGTQCAEVIHDVAPEAELYFVNVKDTEVDFPNGVSWLISQGVVIISSSIALTNEIYAKYLYYALKNKNVSYILSQINNFENLKRQWNLTVDNAVNRGITWVQAAGNYAKDRWFGFFDDPNNNNFLNFTSYADLNEIINYIPGIPIYVLMLYDPLHFGNTYDDYDLWIIDEQGNPQGDCSNLNQLLIPIGIETCMFIPVSGKKYYTAVYKLWGGSKDVGLLLGVGNFGGDFYYYKPYGSIGLSVPSENQNAITVGAVNVRNPTKIEDYSCQGPAPSGIIKPDIVAPDCVSTSFGQFCGTSASTPHVAGLCALVKQVYPNWSPLQIKQYLESNALDLGQNGKDNIYGSGLVKLPPLQLSLEMIGMLENPQDGATVSGITTIHGWAIDGKGIKKVELFVDGMFACNIPYGGSRLDVKNVYPQYPNSENSGFGLLVNFSVLSAGEHLIKIRIHNIDGQTKDFDARINVKKFHGEFVSNFNPQTLKVPNSSVTVGGVTKNYDVIIQWSNEIQGFVIKEIIFK